jgi:hypothetical protein
VNIYKITPIGDAPNPEGWLGSVVITHNELCMTQFEPRPTYWIGGKLKETKIELIGQAQEGAVEGVVLDSFSVKADVSDRAKEYL